MQQAADTWCRARIIHYHPQSRSTPTCFQEQAVRGSSARIITEEHPTTALFRNPQRQRPPWSSLIPTQTRRFERNDWPPAGRQQRDLPALETLAESENGSRVMGHFRKRTCQLVHYLALSKGCMLLLVRCLWCCGTTKLLMAPVSGETWLGGGFWEGSAACLIATRTSLTPLAGFCNIDVVVYCYPPNVPIASRYSTQGA